MNYKLQYRIELNRVQLFYKITLTYEKTYFCSKFNRYQHLFSSALFMEVRSKNYFKCIFISMNLYYALWQYFKIKIILFHFTNKTNLTWPYLTNLTSYSLILPGGHERPCFEALKPLFVKCDARWCFCKVTKIW